MRLEISQGENTRNQSFIDELKKENEELKEKLKDIVTVGKLE